MHLYSLDQLLAADHRARLVWAFVTSLDLEPFYGDIEVTRHVPGRTAIAPEVLLALWLMATLDGIGMLANWLVAANPTSLICGCWARCG